MTDTRRAEFDKWCRDNRWTPTESMWAAWEACSMRYDAATAVQGGEPVAEVTSCISGSIRWLCESAAQYPNGTKLYAAAPPAARQDEGREE